MLLKVQSLDLQKMVFMSCDNNRAQCHSISSKQALIYSTQRMELKVTDPYVYIFLLLAFPQALHRQNFILMFPVVIRTK